MTGRVTRGIAYATATAAALALAGTIDGLASAVEHEPSRATGFAPLSAIALIAAPAVAHARSRGRAVGIGAAAGVLAGLARVLASLSAGVGRDVAMLAGCGVAAACAAVAFVCARPICRAHELVTRARFAQLEQTLYSCGFFLAAVTGIGLLLSGSLVPTTPTKFAVALVGSILLGSGVYLETRRRAWVGAVREGKIAGWIVSPRAADADAMRAVDGRTFFADRIIAPPVGAPPQDADVLERIESGVAPYRLPSATCPVALVPHDVEHQAVARARLGSLLAIALLFVACAALATLVAHEGASSDSRDVVRYVPAAAPYHARGLTLLRPVTSDASPCNGPVVGVDWRGDITTGFQLFRRIEPPSADVLAEAALDILLGCSGKPISGPISLEGSAPGLAMQADPPAIHDGKLTFSTYGLHGAMPSPLLVHHHVDLKSGMYRCVVVSPATTQR